MTSDYLIQDFRNALGTFPTGVTIVTTIDKENKPIGFTANSFTSVSLNPQLISICIDKASFNLESFSNGESFAVNVLSESQDQISTTFARPVTDRFEQIEWESRVTGSPIIKGSAAWFDCAKDNFIDSGDHFILIGRVLAFDSTTKTPLVYLRGNYVNLNLEQKMLLAMENETTRVIVGAIIECRGKIFLMEGQSNNAIQFPTASRLGAFDDEMSLLGKLKKMNILASEHYLFSVFESSDNKTSLIYYRAQIDKEVLSDKGQFYDFNKIPFEHLEDEASRIMLRRYITERGLNAFGIFVGKEGDGKVEAVTKTNT